MPPAKAYSSLIKHIKNKPVVFNVAEKDMDDPQVKKLTDALLEMEKRGLITSLKIVIG